MLPSKTPWLTVDVSLGDCLSKIFLLHMRWPRWSPLPSLHIHQKLHSTLVMTLRLSPSPLSHTHINITIFENVIIQKNYDQKSCLSERFFHENPTIPNFMAALSPVSILRMNRKMKISWTDEFAPPLSFSLHLSLTHINITTFENIIIQNTNPDLTCLSRRFEMRKSYHVPLDGRGWVLCRFCTSI
jgi:hypothetical protein